MNLSDAAQPNPLGLPFPLPGRPRRPVSRQEYWLGGRKYWLCQLLGWGLISGLSLAGNLITNNGGNWREFLIVRLTSLVLGMMTSHGIRLMIFPVREQRLDWRIVAKVLPPIVLATVVMGQTWDLVRWRLGYVDSPLGLFDRRINQLILIFFLQCMWTASYLGWVYYRRYQLSQRELLELTVALREAELRALKSQVNPHFLFNSLNTLRALIPGELERPREAITLLADLLRASLASGQQALVSCETELATVDNYLALEQIRLESRLRVRRAVGAEALAWPVPPFLLQGLVENAVKYGIAPREEGGEIAIEIAVRAGTFRALITNPGRIKSEASSTGLGLRNARERLRFLFGSGADLRLTQRSEDLVAAELVLPRPREEGPR